LTGPLPAGLAWDLAGGLLLFTIFHGLIKRPATLLFPTRHRIALWPVAVQATRLTVIRGLTIGVSLLIGAGTHRLWDSLTHRDGWVVVHVSALRSLLVEVGGYQVTTFKILQHGCTLVGFVALGLVYVYWLKRKSSDQLSPTPVLRPWIRVTAVAVILVFALSIGVTNALLASSSPSGAVRAFVVHLGIGAIAGGFMALITVGLSFRLLGDRLLTDQHG